MLRALSRIAVIKGAYSEAQDQLKESLRQFQEQGDLRNVVDCLESFAALAGACGEILEYRNCTASRNEYINHPD